MPDPVQPQTTAAPEAPAPEINNPTPPAATPPAGTPTTAPVAPAAAPTPLGDVTPPADPANPTPPVQGNWGDDWREKLVGDVTTEDGKKRLTQLQRLADPKAMYEKLLNQEKLISSGQLKKKLPDSPTPEELATYRQENGIPETPDKYDVTLADGMVMGEHDKPVVEAVLARLHAANTPQPIVSEMLNTYFEAQQNAVAERDLADNTFRDETASALRQEWGGDYQPNINLIKGLIAQAPAEAQEGIMNARMPDGRPLMSHPGALRWLANAARQLNPVATVVPGAADPTAAIETELATLKGMMGDTKSEYWKGPNAAKNQARYGQLLEAQQRYKK